MKHIKLILLFAFLFSFSNNSFCQEEIYKSLEYDAYIDSLSSVYKKKEFKPISKDSAEIIPYDYIKVSTLKNFTAYNWLKDIREINQKTFALSKFSDEEFDSVFKDAERNKIGNLYKDDILKEEKRGDKWAIIYRSSDFNNSFYAWGYSISLSYDNGKTWKQYYTGLSENSNYYFKPHSNIPLWKDDNTLQIEAAIVRQVDKHFDTEINDFELVRDGISVELDILKIIQDSDNDGLSDIEEERMLLNKNNSDTDGDGINDKDDKNPRFKSIKTDKSILYDAFIENLSLEEDYNGWRLLDLSNFSSNNISNTYSSFEDEIYLLVSDDKDVQSMDLSSEKIIIMTSKEYESYNKRFPFHFKKKYISKMYKCEYPKDTYFINVSYENSEGLHYLVKRIVKGWKIYMLDIILF